MIGTGKPLDIAAGVVAEQMTTVPAHARHDTYIIIGAAHDEKPVRVNLQAQVVARFGNMGTVAQAHPLAIPDSAPLELEPFLGVVAFDGQRDRLRAVEQRIIEACEDVAHVRCESDVRKYRMGRCPHEFHCPLELLIRLLLSIIIESHVQSSQAGDDYGK